MAEAYRNAKKWVKKYVESDRASRWAKTLKDAWEDMRDNPKEFWTWACGMAGR